VTGISIIHIPLIFAQVKIAVIVVLTKYDLLVVEHHRTCSHISSPSDRLVEAKKRAENSFGEVTEELKKISVPFVPVLTLKKTQKKYGGQLIRSVTSSVSFKMYCRSDAHGIDRGDAEQSARFSRPIVGHLGHCSAN
jgi:hypothetical protein